MPEPHEDERLAAIMRSGLTAQAESAPTRLTGPVPSTRRRSRMTLLAAAAVVAALGTAAALVSIGDPGGVPPSTGTSTTTGSPAPAPVPPDWRLESYAGVEVRVPPTWGWGSVPIGGLTCGLLRADEGPGTDPLRSRTPYVGRPVVVSDLCLTYDPATMAPRGSSVWLGSPLAPGTRRYDGGTVAETVEAAGVRVTVFSSDPDLRRRVLGTLATVGASDDHGCPVRPPVADWPAAEPDALRPTSLSVCLYDTEGSRPPTLVWSARRDADAATAYVEAFDRASAGYDPQRLTGVPGAGQWMALGVNGTVDDAPATRWDTVNFGSTQILSSRLDGSGTAGPVAGPLSASTVDPWAPGSPGLRAYAVGPSEFVAGVSDYFSGPVG